MIDTNHTVTPATIQLLYQLGKHSITIQYNLDIYYLLLQGRPAYTVKFSIMLYSGINL